MEIGTRNFYGNTTFWNTQLSEVKHGPLGKDNNRIGGTKKYEKHNYANQQLKKLYPLEVQEIILNKSRNHHENYSDAQFKISGQVCKTLAHMLKHYEIL